MNNTLSRFDFRFDNTLYDTLRKISLQNHISANQLIRHAIHHAIRLFRAGKLHFCEDSDFLKRKIVLNKKRFHVNLRKSEKEKLIKLAFTMRRSQAEVLRAIIEYYLYVVLGKNVYLKEIYKKKYCHDTRQFNPLVIVYTIGRVLEHQYHMINAPPPYELQFKSR